MNPSPSRLRILKSVLLVVALIALLPPCSGQNIVAITRDSYVRCNIYENDACELYDTSANILWRQDANEGLGQIRINKGGKALTLNLKNGAYQTTADGSILASFHPLTDDPKAEFRVRVRSLGKGAVQVSYAADDALGVESVSLLHRLVNISDSNGYLVVPVREGLLIPADSGIAFQQRFDTYAYEGCHMEMAGAVKDGAALLITWTDPYIALDVRSTTNAPGAACRQELNSSLFLRKSANSFHLQVLGKGDYVAIAKAYRQIAKERGFLVPWSEKLKSKPERAKLFGAANIKLWSVLDRSMNEESTKEESSHLNWTFDEAAQVAEHYKRDLKLDRVLFTIGGWIHRGYDNQHPDILPTAPECGGDTAFANCAQRVMNLGYLFCLHDNYQDIYRDSPSWNEKYVMKTADGKLARGGHWAGGLAFLTCSRMALELAERPQNLAAVRELSGANSYFIDTTYAAGLQECFDPQHPLTRSADIKWKQALSDYARQVFGVFGSECGREWAIPHSDFFEGLTGVSGAYYHDAALPTRLGAVVIPLFELVYRDCIAMYGKYGYDPSRATDYVLHHLTIGRPLNYHSIPAHLYWKTSSENGSEALAVRAGVATVQQVGSRKIAITYRWEVTKTPEQNWMAFVHFTDRAGTIKFQGDYRPATPTSQWKTGEVRDGPLEVELPTGLTGTFSVRMGLFQPATERRALLEGRDNGQRSYQVGRLVVSPDKVEFQPTGESRVGETSGALSVFTRADNGWSEKLHPMDRFIKNTCEILGPLNEVTSQLEMTRHEFLTADRLVQCSTFGSGKDAVQVVVNHGSRDYSWTCVNGGEVVLPAAGFVVESASFCAFYASAWGGHKYSEPAMFVVRSRDGKSLGKSKRIYVYHAFGAEQIRIKGRTESVRTEAELTDR